MSYDPKTKTIKITDGSHEELCSAQAHSFLIELEEDAKYASQQLSAADNNPVNNIAEDRRLILETAIRDHRSALKWLEANTVFALTDQQVKKWTAAYLAYCGRGISPSYALDNTFAMYAEAAKKEKWPTVEVEKEIQALFERLLATEEEIQEKRSGHIPTPNRDALDKVFFKVLENLKSIAKNPNASSFLQREWAKIKDYTGSSSDDFNEQAKRKWAILCRSYLLEEENRNTSITRVYKERRQLAMKEPWPTVPINEDIQKTLEWVFFRPQVPTKQNVVDKRRFYPSGQVSLHVLVAIIALHILALLDMPYGFYTFLKIVTAGCAGIIFYQLWNDRYRGAWLWVWGTICIVFNPVIPIELEKESWQFFNLINVLALSYAAWEKRPFFKK